MSSLFLPKAEAVRSSCCSTLVYISASKRRRQKKPPEMSTSVLRLLLLFTAALATTCAAAESIFYEELEDDRETYDYIVVGGGTAGCPLAATLSQRFKVLLIERGGRGNSDPTVVHEEGFLFNILNSHSEVSPAQSFLSDDGVANVRGRILGGGSSVNAGFYSRADQHFFARSFSLWDDGSLVNDSYRWVEESIVFRPNLGLWQSAFMTALLGTGITPFNGFSVEHVPGTKIGGSIFDASGVRHSAAELLRHADAGNLRVLLYSTAFRIVFSASTRGGGPRAVGVEYLDGRGRIRQASLAPRGRGDVIVCSGAIGSPQLLMLSGVGPRGQLAELGIPSVVDLADVGKGMADNPRSSVTVVSRMPVEYSLIAVVGIAERYYVEASSANVGGINVGTIMEKIARPVSRGELRLNSLDVRENPRVRFNYFDDPSDLGSCVEGARAIGRILRTSVIRNLVLGYVGEGLPANISDDESLEKFCKRSLSTLWHYHGGCVMGRVVDKRYRVKGTLSLRVVDGSTFSESPGTNPQATVMMLGRYVGLQILDERSKDHA